MWLPRQCRGEQADHRPARKFQVTRIFEFVDATAHNATGMLPRALKTNEEHANDGPVLQV
jgi:hypothetical protein